MMEKNIVQLENGKMIQVSDNFINDSFLFLDQKRKTILLKITSENNFYLLLFDLMINGKYRWRGGAYYTANFFRSVYREEYQKIIDNYVIDR